MGCCLSKQPKDEDRHEMHKKSKEEATEIVFVKKKSEEPLGLQFDPSSGNLKLSQAQGRVPKVHKLEKQVGKYLIRMNDVAVTKKSQLSQFKGLGKIKLEFSDKPLTDKAAPATTASTPPIETILRDDDVASSASPGGYQPPSPLGNNIKQSVLLITTRIKKLLEEPPDPQEFGVPIEPYRITSPIVCDDEKTIRQQATAHVSRTMELYGNSKKSFKNNGASTHAVIHELLQNINWIDHQQGAPLELARIICEALSEIRYSEELSVGEMLIMVLFVFGKEQLDYVLGFEGSHISSNTPMLLTDSRWAATTALVQAIASSPVSQPSPPDQLYINIPDPVQHVTDYWTTLRGRWVTWSIPLTASMQIGSRGLIFRVSNPGNIGVPLSTFTSQVLLPGYLPMLVTDTRSPSHGGGTLVVDLLAAKDVSCKPQNAQVRSSLREGLESVLSGDEKLTVADTRGPEAKPSHQSSAAQNTLNLEDLLNSKTSHDSPDEDQTETSGGVDYRYVTVISPAKTKVQGTYAIRKKLIEDAPSWVSRGGQYMLQSKGGRWIIRTNTTDDGNAIIASSQEHEGELPFSITSWHVSVNGSWIPDGSISVALGEGDPKISKRSVSWSKTKVTPGSPFDEPEQSVDPFTTPTTVNNSSLPQFTTPTVPPASGWGAKQSDPVVVKKSKPQKKHSKPKSVVDLRVTRVDGNGPGNYRVQQHGYWGKIKK